jgi:hypothetical protein
MRLVSLVAALSTLSMLGGTAVQAYVEFGEPDFPNYLSVPGVRGTCDWWTGAWMRACPVPTVAPVVVAPAPAAPVVKKAK